MALSQVFLSRDFGPLNIQESSLWGVGVQGGEQRPEVGLRETPGSE